MLNHLNLMASTDDDLRLLSLLADQMAVAIENAALYERLRRHSAELESTVASRTSELANALDRAKEADRLKTQFVSDVSHELRTPLSNIRLYIELLGQAPIERQPGYIETLNRETERLVTLIEDLLSISRLDAGTSPPELDPGWISTRCHVPWWPTEASSSLSEACRFSWSWNRLRPWLWRTRISLPR